MKWFDYVAPLSIDEAVALLSDNLGSVPLAGGTDLLIQLRTARKLTDLVVDLKRLPKVNEILRSSTGMVLGAAVPCYQIRNNRMLVEAHPALAELATIIGGTQIQGRASIGGNLCNAAPSADAIPLLIAMGATCELSGPNGQRMVPVEDFCVGPGLTVLQRGELLIAIHLPAEPRNSGCSYLRFTPRNEMDIAVAGVGVKVLLENDCFCRVRLALSALGPVPLFVREADEALAGAPVNRSSVDTAVQLAMATIKPISDVRGTAEYRRHLCGVLVRRAMAIAIERARTSK